MFEHHPTTASGRRRPARAIRRCVVGALLCAATVVAAPSPAGAQLVDAQCTGTMDQSWSPGLTLAERTVTYTAHLDYDCTSSDPHITGAEIHVHAQYSSNCLVNTGATTATVEWDSGETSEIQLEPVGVTVGGGVQVYEAPGTVTSGKFAGDTLNMLNTFVSLDLLACLTPQGMTHRSGTTMLTVLNV